MKIGILTFHKTLNYGAILQAYALQEAIKILGHEAEIINYRCDEIYKREFPRKLGDIKSIKAKIKYVFGVNNREKKKKKIIEFIESYINLSDREYSKDSISDSNEVYDSFITGSDQVWNEYLTGGDTTYYLDFVKDIKKKNSYAASFGYGSVPDVFVSETKDKLSLGYNKLSVREQSGKKIIKELVGVDAEVVLDPTLLFGKETWINRLRLKNTRIIKDKYILVYQPHNKKYVFDFAKELSAQSGARIIYINITYIPYPGFENVYDVSPNDFVQLIADAEYVVTGSFHGVAFSINLEKEFYYEDSPNTKKTGSRIESLTKITGTADRKISNGITGKKIDYAYVNGVLEKERVKSLDYLTGCFIDEGEKH